jgi:tetratricopeptide (TPR) repeat protein
MIFSFRHRNPSKRNAQSDRETNLFRDRALRGKRSPLPGELMKLAADQLKSGTALALIATVVVVGLWLFVSFMLGIFSPRPMVVVQPFEISEEVAKQLHLSGKNAADIFVDRLNSLANDGRAFRGNVYSSGKHFGRVSEMIKIPVESSFGIEFKGVPVDAVVALFNRVRYQQVPVRGDVTLTASGVAIRVRWSYQGDAEWLSSAAPLSGDLETSIDSLAEQFLEHLNPELAGRAYLQESQPSNRTIGSFAQWAMNEPGSPEPFFYIARSLALKAGSEVDTNLSQREHAEAIAAAQWAKGDLEWLQPNAGSAPCTGIREPRSAADDIRSGYYRISATFASVIRPETGADRATSVIASEQHSEKMLEDLTSRYPWDTHNLVNLGVVYEARGDYDGALRVYETAAVIEPNNEGIQRNIGAEFINKAYRERDPDTRQSFLCYALQHDNRALHLSLGMSDALTDAVQVLHELHDDNSALTLADLMHVVQPNNGIVQRQYLLALVTVGRNSEAIDSAIQGMKDDALVRDLVLVKLIRYILDSRGPAPALNLAEACAGRWKTSVPLQLAVTALRNRIESTNSPRPAGANM